ncbi:hypothetical protein MR813_06505 [bacterium]|nr:hypothetical protein [bacterium]
MKNFFKSLAICALAALTFASCQKENADGNMDDQSSVVSINLTSPLMGTKAFADGTTVNVVHVHVYQHDANGNLTYIAPATQGAAIETPSKDVAMSAGAATYSTRLVTGQKYTFVFWAEKKDKGHYTYNPDTKAITVNYAGAAGNDETRDAFYAVLENVTINGAYSASVALKRPFAQINFGASDYDAAVAAGITVTGASVKLTGIANSINLLDGTVSGRETVTFAEAVLPTAPNATLSAAGENYKYVAMDYVLVGNGTKTLSDVTLTLAATGTLSTTPEYTYTNVPLQGNYRTNIVGSLFTSPADINITVDPAFGDTEVNIEAPNVASIAAANEALNNGATSVTIAYVTASEAGTTKLLMPATSENITVTIEEIESTANLQIEKPATGSNPASVSVTLPASASVANLTINLPESHVEVNGATYNSITATTSNNTLVIGSDVKVTTLTINAGSAIIYGKVTTLVKGENAGKIEWHVTTSSYLTKALKVADKIVLEKAIKPIVLSSSFTIDRDVTIDLNGFSLTSTNYPLKITKGNVNIIGSGELIGAFSMLLKGSTDDVADYCVVNLGPDVVLKASSCGIIINPPATSGYDNYGIVVNSKAQIISDAESSIGITINGSNKITGENVPKFNITGGKIDATVGIYAAGYAEWNLSNCEVEGDLTAIEIRAGKMTIDGGTYTSYKDPFDVEPNGSGTTTEGAALGISQHATNLPIDVVVNGGTFNGAYAIWEKDVQNEEARDQIKLTVNNGTFNGAIYSQNNPNAIIKGTYSDPSALHYLADDADVKIEMTADNEITSEVSVSQKAEINLNDHKLKVSAYFSTIGSGSLAISNGSIECVDPSVANPLIRSYGSSHMSFDDVVMTSNGSAVYVGDECNFTIKNSTIEAEVYGISTNASNPNQNPTINIESCTIKGNDPVLVNIPCSLTVKASNLNGIMHGAVVRGGTATFTDCQISLNYPDNDAESMAKYFLNRNWGEGNMVNLAALTIGNKHATSYQYPTNVSLVNTEVKVEGVYANYFPSLYAYANSGEGLGVTLTYDENCTFTGGTEMSYGSTNIVVNGTAVNAE